jgi:membrane-bound lytic murein transglycosylase A
MPRSRWLPVPWSELPSWTQDNVSEAWPALQRSCQRKLASAWATVCAELEGLSFKDAEQKRQWLMQRFQPFRIEDPQTRDGGLLTAYFEPAFAASRVRKPGFEVPIHMPAPELLRLRDATPWFSRRELETLPAAQAALRGREIAYLSDPVDAMVLHIQGSGRLQLQEADGTLRQVRLSFAATNNHSYQSIGRWLLDRRLTQDASWPGIKKWLAANPQRRNELLWANPRYVFFKEEPLVDPAMGPRGAQGVALTAGRSIAVDPQSLPYGTPVWLVSEGAYPLRKLVVAQDTGSAIVGAVRADFFVGSGDAAGDLAGRLRQNLRLWALWPK